MFRHLNERTASLEYIKQMLQGLEKDLKEDLVAVEEVFAVPNPLLRGLLKKLEL